MTDRTLAITNLVYDSAAFLDAEDVAAFFALVAPEFHYRLTAFSDEIGKKMTWIDHGREALRNLMEHANDHERHLVRFNRHVTAVRAADAADGGLVPVRSALIVYYTDLEGQTGLYAVGSYLDRVRFEGAKVALVTREVALATRKYPFGCHYPL